jgi:hypothetical protein
MLSSSFVFLYNHLRSQSIRSKVAAKVDLTQLS